MSSFPTLFGESSHGKTKMWSVAVVERDGNGVIVQTHGYVDGKQVVNERVVTAGKNIGKKNATTAVSQAVAEAQSIWNKKKDAGYKPSETAPVVTNSDEVEPEATGGDVPLPMLAQDFNKRGKSIAFPCFAQRKLDGVRCVAISGKGLFSRNGKATSVHLTHIRADVDSLPAGTILDGELYSDDLTFQEIVGLVKKGTLKAGDADKMKKIHLCVYDTIRDASNADRNAWLQSLFASNTFASLRLLPTVTCASVEDVKNLHAAYVAEGYEGLILRNMAGKYNVGHRSTDLQKYKEFEDAEYPVCGFKEGDGVEKGCVIWVCRTADGKEFAVRPRGTHEERLAAYATAGTMIGKPLTVRYQELTTDGIPRFPVGIAFRTYE
jgi:ATP-dependent DNA ligase